MRKLLTLFSLVAWWAAGQSTDVDRRAKLPREIRDLIDQTPAAPPELAADILLRLVEAGKIRFYGVSVERVEEALKAIEYPNVQTVQIIFNCFRQRPAALFFEQAAKKQVGILARVPLASGMLTGRWPRAVPPPRPRCRDRGWR